MSTNYDYDGDSFTITEIYGTLNIVLTSSCYIYCNIDPGKIYIKSFFCESQKKGMGRKMLYALLTYLTDEKHNNANTTISLTPRFFAGHGTSKAADAAKRSGFSSKLL